MYRLKSKIQCTFSFVISKNFDLWKPQQELTIINCKPKKQIKFISDENKIYDNQFSVILLAYDHAW